MPKTRRTIAREVDDILAGKPSTPPQQRGEAAYEHIQEEARAAESWMRMTADSKDPIPAQKSPRSAHHLVSTTLQQADQVGRYIEFGQAWVREARGTPQLPAVERILLSIKNTALRAKRHAAATQSAFEKRFGKYDPRGVTDQNLHRST